MIIISQPWSFSEILNASPFLGRIPLTKFEIDDLKVRNSPSKFAVIFPHLDANLCNEQLVGGFNPFEKY